MNDKIPCKCGCGELIPATYPNGRPRSYVMHHHSRGRHNYWLKSDKPNKTTAHEGARRWVRQRERCELEHIGGCNGKLDVAHKDHDPWNNDPDNLMTVCRSHHRLYDHGWIDLADPKMPDFYVDAGGKRRYRKASK